MDLTAKQRQFLKGLAHHIKPIVSIGKDGFSEGALRQLLAALEHHELVKVRLLDAAPFDRAAAAAQFPAWSQAHLVQNVGRVFVLYRRNSEKPRIELPIGEGSAIRDVEAPDLATARTPRARMPGTIGPSVRDADASVLPALRKPTGPVRPMARDAGRATTRETKRGRRGPVRRPRAKPQAKTRGANRGRRGVSRKR